MAYYALVDVKVDDMERYREYMAKAQPTIEAAGGEYLVRGGDFEVFEGTGFQPNRLVLIRFQSEEKFRAWYESDAYREAREIRLPVSSMTLVGVQGADE